MIKEREIKAANQAELTEAFHEIPCSNLTDSEKSQAVALVAQAGVPETYIEPRLKSYDAAVMFYKGNKLLAFQLVQQFVSGNAVYIYFGPAFSGGGALMQLYGWYIKELHCKFPEQDIMLLAEIQNPKMLMVLHGMFGKFGYSFLNETIPPSILKTVSLFTQKYSHIGRFNPNNFTTTAAYSLFKENHGCHVLAKVISRKKILLSQGDSMLFVASIPHQAETRKAVLEQVRQGIEAVCNWAEFKSTFLKRFTVTE